MIKVTATDADVRILCTKPEDAEAIAVEFNFIAKNLRRGNGEAGIWSRDRSDADTGAVADRDAKAALMTKVVSPL